MTTTRYLADDAAAWAYLAASDFSPLRARALAANPHWSSATADRAVRAYKQFLYVTRLMLAAGERVSPHKAVDALWHEHILHTRRYMADCEVLFGHYLHHEPGTSATPSVADTTAYQRTNARLRALFGPEGDPEVALAESLRSSHA
jgi:hypothetical protein